DPFHTIRLVDELKPVGQWGEFAHGALGIVPTDSKQTCRGKRALGIELIVLAGDRQFEPFAAFAVESHDLCASLIRERARAGTFPIQYRNIILRLKAHEVLFCIDVLLFSAMPA